MSAVASAFAALAFAGSALAAADATITSTSSTITSYFTDNLPTVIGAFVAVAGVLWLLGMLTRSVGVGRSKKVG